MKRMPVLRIISVSLFVCAWLLAGSQAVYADDCGIVGWFVGCAYVNHDRDVHQIDVQIETVKADAVKVQAQQAALGLANAAQAKAEADARVAEAVANGTINKAMYDAQARANVAMYDAQAIQAQADAQYNVAKVTSDNMVTVERVKTGAESWNRFMLYLLMAAFGAAGYGAFKTHTRAKVEIARSHASITAGTTAIDRYAGLAPWMRQAARHADKHNYRWEVKSAEELLVTDGTTTRTFTRKMLGG